MDQVRGQELCVLGIAIRREAVPDHDTRHEDIPTNHKDRAWVDDPDRPRLSNGNQPKRAEC